jgi:hypothetical protein
LGGNHEEMSTACPSAITKQSLSDHDARIVLNSGRGGNEGQIRRATRIAAGRIGKFHIVSMFRVDT